MTKYIIDTDIGSDIDDSLALLYAIKSNLDTKLLTTVHADPASRAKHAVFIYHNLGLGEDFEICVGEKDPIKQRQHFTTGFENKHVNSIFNLKLEENAVGKIIETVHDNPGIEIICLGPLTNIAKAFEEDPSICSKINHIYMMGNAILRDDEFIINYRSHNFKVDAEAVDIVMKQDISKTIITTEVGKSLYFGIDKMKNLTGNKDIDAYLSEFGKDYLSFIKSDKIYLYDPIVVEAATGGDNLEYRTYGNTRISTSIDKKFKDKFLETVGKN